jgi:hypothetical protein
LFKFALVEGLGNQIADGRRHPILSEQRGARLLPIFRIESPRKVASQYFIKLGVLVVDTKSASQSRL